MKFNFTITHFLFGVFIVLSLQQTYGQNFTLKGRIVNRITHQPLGNVMVANQENGESTKSDTSGFFSIAKMESGSCHLDFSLYGYEPQTLFVTDIDTEVSVSFQPKFNELNDVNVNANRLTTHLQNPTLEPLAWETSITRISSNDIRNSCSNTAFEALKYTTSGNICCQGRKKTSFYMVRGQDVASDYAINGISLSTNGAGPMAQWVEAPTLLPTSMIESMEVVRSSNSLLLGFSGLNGVVNIKTRTFDHFETNAEVEYGSFNKIHAGVVHGGKIGGFDYAFSVAENETNGPTNRHGAENLLNVYGKAGYHYKNWLSLNLEQFYTRGTRNVVQATNDNSLTSTAIYSQIWKYNPMVYSITTAKLKVNESENYTTELQYSYILNRLDFYGNYFQYNLNPITGKTEVSDKVVEMPVVKEPDSIRSFALFQSMSFIPHNVMRVAAMYVKSANYAHGKSKKSITSATFLDEQDFGRLNVNAGIKFIKEYYEYYFPNTGTGSDLMAIKNKWQPWHFNASGGASALINNRTTVNLVLNAGTIPADKSSLKLNTDGTTTYITDESRVGTDLGLVYKQPRIGQWSCTSFIFHRKNAAEYTSKPYLDQYGQQLYYMDNVDLQTIGLEIAFESVRMANLFTCFANASYQYTQNLSTSTHYMKQPPFISNMGVHLTKNAVMCNLMAKYVSSYTSDRFLTQTVFIGNYLNIDLNVGYDIPHAPLQVYGSVINLTDKRYATVSPAYPDYGRQYMIGLKATF